jgi:hypothetical protein
MRRLSPDREARLLHATHKQERVMRRSRSRVGRLPIVSSGSGLRLLYQGGKLSGGRRVAAEAHPQAGACGSVAHTLSRLRDEWDVVRAEWGHWVMLPSVIVGSFLFRVELAEQVIGPVGSCRPDGEPLAVASSPSASALLDGLAQLAASEACFRDRAAHIAPRAAASGCRDRRDPCRRLGWIARGRRRAFVGTVDGGRRLQARFRRGQEWKR